MHFKHFISLTGRFFFSPPYLPLNHMCIFFWGGESDYMYLVIYIARFCTHVFLLFFFSHAQSLAALQAYCHWLAQFCSEVQRQQDQTRFVDLVTSCMAATTPLVNAKVIFLIKMTLSSKEQVKSVSK